MDLMAQRYADPYLILNDFIRCGQLHEFSIKIIQRITEEKVWESQWEYFLHKVWDMSLEEYVAACEPEKEKVTDAAQKSMQREEAMDIIYASRCILEEFKF